MSNDEKKARDEAAKRQRYLDDQMHKANGTKSDYDELIRGFQLGADWQAKRDAQANTSILLSNRVAYTVHAGNPLPHVEGKVSDSAGEFPEDLFKCHHRLQKLYDELRMQFAEAQAEIERLKGKYERT